MQMSEFASDDPKVIEAVVAEHRKDLAQTLSALGERLTVPGLATEAAQSFKASSKPFIEFVDGAVRANPIPSALVGVGLAWMLLGRRSSRKRRGQAPAEPLWQSESRWDNEGGNPAPPDHALTAEDEIWLLETERLRNTAIRSLSGIDDAVRYDLVSRDRAADERTNLLARLSRDTAAVMRAGLDGLSSAARDKIVDARAAFVVARIAARENGGRMIEQHPVVAGSIAALLGALVGSSLPQTEAENKLFGLERERVMGELRRAFQTQVRA